MSDLCPCCMEEHALKVIHIREYNMFQGVAVEYEAEYCYCDLADEAYADERQIRTNHEAMRRVYDLWKLK